MGPSLIDLWVFFQQGVSLWQGQYNSFYPLPMVGFYALLSLMPFWFVALLICGLSLIVLVAVCRYRAVAWAFYPPFILGFVVGQPDMLFVGLYAIGSPVALALMTLKPQLLVFALPKLARFTRAEWKRFLFWVSVLYVPATLVMPSWPVLWMRAVLYGDARLSNSTSASFWAEPVLFLLLLPLVLLLLRRSLNPHALVLSLNPALRDYDYSLLLGRSLWLIPAGWAILLLKRALYGYDFVAGQYWWSLLGIVAVLTDPAVKKPRWLADIEIALKKMMPIKTSADQK
jgi:hypothetical protein